MDFDDDDTGCGCCMPLYNFALTDFTVSPVVVVRSKWLRVPEMVLILFATLTLFVYYLGYSLRVLEHHVVDLAPLLEAQPPYKNFWTCTRVLGNCVTDWPTETPEYCLPPGENTGYQMNDTHGACETFPFMDLLPPGQASDDRLQLALSQATFREDGKTDNKLCKQTTAFGVEVGQVDDCTKPGVREIFVQGAEKVNIKIRASISLVPGAPNEQFSSDETKIQSLLKFQDGRIQRLSSLAPVDGKPVEFPGPHEEYFKRNYPEVCGDVSGEVNMCASTLWGDYISLAILLEAANVTLTPALRRVGFVLDLGIRYTNQDSEDFWSLPWGPKPKLIYEPRVRHFSGSDSVSFNRRNHMSNSSDEPNAEIDIMRSLALRSSAEGEYARWSWFRMLTELAIVSTILTLVKSFVKRGVARLYKMFGDLRHVYYVQEIASRKVTPECTGLQGAAPEDVEQALSGMKSHLVEGIRGKRAGVSIRPLRR